MRARPLVWHAANVLQACPRSLMESDGLLDADQSATVRIRQRGRQHCVLAGSAVSVHSRLSGKIKLVDAVNGPRNEGGCGQKGACFDYITTRTG